MYEGRLNPILRALDDLSEIEPLGFFDGLRSQTYRTAIDFTTGIVAALLQADIFDLGTLLDGHRTAFDFRIFN